MKHTNGWFKSAVALVALAFGLTAQADAVDPLQPEGSVEVTDGFYQNGATYGAATEFYITSKDGFHFFRNLINQENGAIDDYRAKGFYGLEADQFYTENPFKNKTVKLLCDVDEGDVAVKPIGMTDKTREDGKDKRYFYGIFDGGNHTISNLRVIDTTAADKRKIGLFGTVTRNAEVAMAGVVNLTVSNAVVSGYRYVGAFIGGLSGVVTLTNCHLKGSVTLSAKSKYLGGLVGHNGDSVDSQIIACSVDVSDGSTLTTGSQGGGLVGYMGGGDIVGCTVRGLSISATSSYVLGGIAGKFCTTGCVAASNTVDSVTITAKEAGASGSIIGSFGAAGQTLIDNTVVNTHVYDPNDVEVFGQCHWFASGDTTTVIGWDSVGTLTEGGITGGTFERLPTSYLASGYELVAQGTTPETYVVQAKPVARVGETQYMSLAEAVTAASAIANSTITLLADCTVDSAITINNGNIKTIDGTNTVDSGYYTITVKDGGTFTIDYSKSSKYTMQLGANVTNERTSGVGLSFKFTSYRSFTAYGNVAATGADTLGYGIYYGSVVAPDLAVTSAAMRFYGSVNVKSISAGLFYGMVTAPNGSITGGTYYNADAIAAVDAAKADGYALAKNSTKSWTVGLPDTIVIATLKHGDTVTNYTDPSYAVSDSVSGDVITMVKSASGALVDLNKAGLTLVMPNGVTVWRIKCASTCKLVTTVESDRTIYESVALTIDDASAYVVNGTTTNFYNSIDNAISYAQSGDSVYLNADRSGNIEMKVGVTLYLNGKTVSGAVIMASGSGDHCLVYNEENQSYTTRLRTADDADAALSIVYTSDGQPRYFATFSGAFGCVKNGTTITMLKDVSVNDDDYTGSYICGNSLTSGKTLDGQGHTVTYTGSKTPQFMSSLSGTITNMTFVGMRNAIAYTAYSGATFDYVKIIGQFENAGHNFGAYTIYQRGTATFRNCEMAANCFDNGGKTDYNAAFIGQISSASTLNFENCKMTGNLTCGTAGMFFANCAYGIAITLNIKDTYNEGLIQAVYLADQEESQPYKFNPFTAVSWDGQLNQLTVNLDNENLEGTYSGTTELTSAALFEALKRNGGQFLNGPTDTTLALAKNGQGGFAATTAANEDAVKYVISVGIYAKLSFYGQSAGTSFFDVTETITTDQHGVKVLPTIMDYRFVDATWVAANPTAVPGEYCGAKTYTLNDETFYYVEEGDNLSKRTLWGSVSPADSYSISAYDADNNLLASATLSSSAYALKTSATAPGATVTYLYDTLEAAVQNVEQNGTITILADNAETFTAAPKAGVTDFTIDNSADYELTGTVTAPAGYEFTVNGDGTCTYGAAKPVCRIGETTYATLEAAIDAANESAEPATIVLIADTAIAQTVSLTSSMAFDLNGHTLTNLYAGGRAFALDADEIEVTVSEGCIVDGTAGESYGFFDIRADSVSLGFENVDVGVFDDDDACTERYDTSWGAFIKVRGGLAALTFDLVRMASDHYIVESSVGGCSVEAHDSTFVIDHSAGCSYGETGDTAAFNIYSYEYEGGYADSPSSFDNVTITCLGGNAATVRCLDANCDAVVSNCTFTTDGCGRSVAIGVSSEYTVTVVGGTYSGQYAGYVYSSGGTINFTDTTLSGSNKVLFANTESKYQPTEACINVYGSKSKVSGDMQVSSANTYITLYGGVYDRDPRLQLVESGNQAIRLADGYKVAANTSPKTRAKYPFKVVLAPVAQVIAADGAETNEYTTLQAAFDAVEANETILMLRDNAEDIVVTKTVPFYFNADGHALTGATPDVPDGWQFVKVGDVCTLGEIVPTGEETEAVVITAPQTASVDTNGAAKVISDPEVVEKIGQNTVVTGVKLSPTNEEHFVSGAQSVVTVAKETGSVAFKANLENGTNVIIQVDVEVKPTAYTAPEEEKTEGAIKFSLKPIATVTIDEGGDNKTNTVAVTNEMIDQLQDIAVTVYTGFKPVQAIHTDKDGNRELFAESEITYDSATGNATIIIHHFSDVVFYEESKEFDGVRVADCSDGISAKQVTIPGYWLRANDITDDVATNKTITANGLPAWKSYVFGLDPNETVAAGNLQVLPQNDGTVDVTFYGVTDEVQTDLATVTFAFYADTEVTGDFATKCEQEDNAYFENMEVAGGRRFFKNASIRFTWK